MRVRAACRRTLTVPPALAVPVLSRSHREDTMTTDTTVKNDALERLAQGITELTSSEAWIRWL